MKISEALLKLRKLISEDLVSPVAICNLEKDFDQFEDHVNAYYDGEVRKCDWDDSKSSWDVKLVIRNDIHRFYETFEKYLTTNVNIHLNNIRKLLVIQNMDDDAEKFKNLIDKLDIEFHDLISECKKNAGKSHDIVAELLLQFVGNIKTKYHKQNLASTSNVNLDKIKWLGNTNTLATLFYDLSHEDNNLKKQLIEYDNTALTNFIIHNFVDAQGNPLSKSGIYTVLNERRTDKRAKKERFIPRESVEEAIPVEAIPENHKIQKKNHRLSKGRLPKNINPDTLK